MSLLEHLGQIKLSHPKSFKKEAEIKTRNCEAGKTQEVKAKTGRVGLEREFWKVSIEQEIC